MKTNDNLTAARSYSSAAGTGRSWLGGWGGLVVCALAVVGAILAFGGAFGGAQDVGKWLLPLLFVLPCAIMMFMCMRHMGGNQTEASGSNLKAGARKVGTEDGR